MAGFDRMWPVLGRCTPPDRLKGQVLERVHELRAGQRREGSIGAHALPCGDEEGGILSWRFGTAGRAVGVASGREAVSRRGFVAAGVTACLGAGAVGTGLVSWLIGGAGTGTVGGAGAGASSPTKPFGLVAAYADEGDGPAGQGGSVALEAHFDGLLPMGDTTSPFMDLKLNLSCTGEGVETVTYTLTGDVARLSDGSSLLPVPDAVLGDAVWDFYDYGEETRKALENQVDGAVQFYTMQDPRTIGTEKGERLRAWMDARSLQRLEAGLDPLEWFSFTVDYADEPGWDGTFETEWGDAYRVLGVSFANAFWEIDEVLAAKRAWLDAGVKGGEASDETRAGAEAARVAYGTYEELFRQVAATEESLYIWLQSVNRACFRLAADTLAQAVLTVEATFDDGSSARRDYRIEAIEDLDEAADGRFDALVERFGLGEGAYDPSLAPFCNFSGYVPEENEPDERLTRALFVIVDITAG